MPLNSLIKKHHYSLSPFESTMIKELSANGNLLALPYDFGPVVITYNKALFQAEGRAGTAERLDLVAVPPGCPEADGGGGIYGYLPVTLGGTSLPLELAYNLSGVPDAYVKNGTFNLTNPDFIKGIQTQAELSYKYHVTPPYSTAPGWSSQEFTSGKVGMEVNGPWDLINLKSQAQLPRWLGGVPRRTQRSAHLQRGLGLRDHQGLQEPRCRVQGTDRPGRLAGPVLRRQPGPRVPGAAV